MQMPSSTKTEHRAVNALEVIIDEHSTMEHQINGNDKEMSWDGYIWLYKKNNGKQSKENFEARVPVQVKGHNDNDRKYLGKNRIMYSVELSDLSAYATEKGVLYFQIFICGKEREIYYSSLYPSKIADYLEDAKKKGNSISISVPFSKLEKNADKLYIIAKQFSDEALKQGSAYTSLVQDRIKSIDFDKLTSINLTVVGARNYHDALMRLSSGDVCIYGKTAGDKYFRPMEWHDESKYFVGKDVENEIAIGNEVYYHRYRCITDSDGGIMLKLSPNLSINIKGGRFDFSVTSTISELGNDARFLLKLKETDSFTVQGHTIGFKDPDFPEDFENRLKFIVDLYETLKMIKFNLNTPISVYTDEEQTQFIKIVNIRLGAYNKNIKDEISIFNWNFGGKYFPLLIIKKEDHIELVNSLYTDKYAVFIPDPQEVGRGYRMPLFVYHGADVLGNLYSYDYEAFKKQIDDCDYNSKTGDALLECLLIIINVFDINRDEHFLELSKYLLKKIEYYIPRILFLLNEMQIKKRETELDDDDLELLRNIEDVNPEILFGKYVLLEDKDRAEESFSKLSIESQKRYKGFPIYNLYKNL